MADAAAGSPSLASSTPSQSAAGAAQSMKRKRVDTEGADEVAAKSLGEMPAGFPSEGGTVDSMYPRAPGLDPLTEADAVVRQRLTAERLCNYCADKDTNLMRTHIEEQFFVICDKSLPDCPISYASDGFMTLTGYTRSEVLGRNCRFLQGPGTDPESVLAIRHAVENDESLTINLLNYKKNGEKFWNMLQLTPVKDGDGICTAIVGCQQEITQDTALVNETIGTLSAIDAILNCENDARILKKMPQSSLTFVVATPSIQDCPMTLVSDSFCKLTGYTRAECIGRNCRFLQGPDTDPDTVQRLGEAVRSGTPTTVKILNYKKDGSKFWNLLHLSPVTDAAGNVVRIIGAQTDISSDRDETMDESKIQELTQLSKTVSELVDELGDEGGVDMSIFTDVFTAGYQ